MKARELIDKLSELRPDTADVAILQGKLAVRVNAGGQFSQVDEQGASLGRGTGSRIIDAGVPTAFPD